MHSGGSLVSYLKAQKSALIRGEEIIVIVRSDEQAKRLLDQGVHALQVDLSDEGAVLAAIQRHNGKGTFLAPGLLMSKLLNPL